MSTSSTPNASGRVLRPRLARVERTAASDLASTDQHINTEKSKKRPRSKDVQSHQAHASSENISNLLEERGVSVGSRTSRGRLLEMLDKYVKPKRTRLVEKSREAPADKRNETTTTQNVNQVSTSAVDFERFDIPALVEMVRSVGVSTEGVDKAGLVRICKVYEDLIVVPSDCYKFTFQYPPKEIRQPIHDEPLAGSNITSTPDKPSSRPNRQQPLACVNITPSFTDSSSLPSLEHQRFLLPRPRPTRPSSLSVSRTSNLKGKSKARDTSEEEFIPTDKEDSSESDNEEPSSGEEILQAGRKSQGTSTHRKRPTFQMAKEPTHNASPSHLVEPQDINNGSNSPPDPSTGQPAPSNSQPAPGESTIVGSKEWVVETIFKLKNGLSQTNERMEAVTNEVRLLSDIVKKSVGVGSHDEAPIEKTKTRGGRIASHVRFHIDTLFGQKNQTLPHPATDEDKKYWTYLKSDDSVASDMPFDLPTIVQTSDPHFPYKNGPGHKDATSQQLKIMWHMMRAVGVSSFRPDFNESTSSKDNKFLWELAFNIFVKLVECGEYSGVPLGKKGLQAIRKAFRTRVQSLKAKCRKQEWDEERVVLNSQRTRRGARLRYVKKLRDQAIIPHKSLWGLSRIIDVACSEDETDHEECSTDISDLDGSPCHILQFVWRSSELEYLFVRLDLYKQKLDRCIPKKGNSSPSRAGRPCRPRVRCENRKPSQTEAPVGLPVDCINKQWYDSLELKDQLSLKIDPNPILHILTPPVEALLASLDVNH